MPQWFSYVFYFLKKLVKTFHQKSSCRTDLFHLPGGAFLFSILLFFRNQHGFASHVWAQHFRNIYGTVRIEIIFQESDQHTRRSDHCIIQCVRKVFAIFSSHADL